MLIQPYHDVAINIEYTLTITIFVVNEVENYTIEGFKLKGKVVYLLIKTMRDKIHFDSINCLLKHMIKSNSLV